MAGRGPAPKPANKRARRNREEPETRLTKQKSAAKAKTPALPGSKGFLAATRAWYATWASSPQASQFIETDWLRLHMTARLVDLFYRSEFPSEAKQLMSEIRLNEAKLGGTPEDRLRLRWRLGEAERAAELEQRKSASPTQKPRRRGDPRLKLVQGGSGSA
jgi:hypothetical protein